MNLCDLVDNVLSMGQLNNSIPLGQSALHQHLNYLREVDLVVTMRELQTIYYQLKGNEMMPITVLKSIYCLKWRAKNE